MTRILVLGGGFGGLITAKRIAGSLGPTHQVTLVSPSPNFTFYPALVNLAFGQSSVEDVTFELVPTLSDQAVRFVQGEMIGIDSVRKRVNIVGDDFTGEIAYDYLVIASGRRLATEQISGFFEYANHLLGTKAALRFGDAVRSFRSGNIIVGLCPDALLPVPVCETAFELARKFESEMQQGDIRISVIFPESLKEAFGGARIHQELESAFERHNIAVHYDIPISEITSDKVVSHKKHEIDYDLLMLLPPFRGNASFRDLNITDENDFVKVNELMQVDGLENTYAVGDIVAFSGPKLAHMAVRQAEVAAANIVSEIKGKKPVALYQHEIAAIIDSGGADSIYLHYGIWDDSMYRLKKGRFWSWAKHVHDAFWKTKNS